MQKQILRRSHVMLEVLAISPLGVMENHFVKATSQYGLACVTSGLQVDVTSELV
jgi:hypothetical protein